MPSRVVVKMQGLKRYISRFTSQQTGLSLISSLWILTVLSVLATQFLYSIRLDQRVQANFADRMKYYYAAKAGFEHTIAILRGDETPYDAAGEEWANPVEGELNDGITVGGTLTYHVEIVDEGSKVNVNTADVNVIRSVLALLGYEEESNPTQQSLADAVVQGRPYRTVRDLARVDGMTTELLYGQQATGLQAQEETTEPDSGTQAAPGLIDLVTVYSIDKNTDSSGQQRANINSADAQRLTQIQGNNNQAVFSDGEAQSLIQQRNYDNIGALLDARTITEQTFNNLRDRLSVDSQDDNQQLVNINTADADRLQTLDGIDQGMAQRIIAHRDSNGNFQNVDQIRDVTLISEDEFRAIVDKITTIDEETVSGLVNINTAPQEILALLPGMDETKAQAIVQRRETPPEDSQQAQALKEQGVEGNPFTDIAQLLDVQGIDMNTFRQLAGLVTYRSHGFLIEASGIDPLGKTIANCVAVIDRTGQQLIVKYWKQE